MKYFNRSIAAEILIAFALVCFAAQIIAVNVISEGNSAVIITLIDSDITIIIVMTVYFFFSLSRTRKRRAESEVQLCGFAIAQTAEQHKFISCQIPCT